MSEMGRWGDRAKWLPAIIFFAAFGLFLSRSAPTVAPLDSTELAAVASTLGIAHGPGYPLYSLSGKAWSVLAALGNGAYRANIFSAACSAGALALLAAAFASEGWAAGLTAALVLFVAGAFQREAVSAEVFALNTLVAAFLVFLARGTGARRFLLAVFALALGLGNQHTLVLASPLLIALFPEEWRDRRLWVTAAAFFALGLSVYLFLYLRALRHPVMDWEEPDTLAGLWRLVSRARYGTLALAQGGSTTPWSMDQVTTSIFLYTTLLRENIGVLAFLGLAGMFRLTFRSEKLATGLFAAWALSGPCFFIMCKMGLGENSQTIMERFLPLSLVFVAACAGEAAAWVPQPWTPGVLALFLLWFPFLRVQARDSWALADLARNHFRTLPPSSVFIADRADEVEFAAAYLHQAEARRPDLSFIDANAGVTPSQYGRDYYAIWGPPRLRRREQVENALIEASTVPVYYATLEPDQLQVKRQREGLLWRAKGPPRELDFDEVYVTRRAPSTTARERLLSWSRWRLEGEYALGRGDAAAAFRDFMGAAAAGSDPGYDLHWAGVAFIEKNRFAEGARMVELSLLYRPEPLAWSNLGAARERLGDMDGALVAYRKAVQLGPQAAIAHRNLGAACWKVQEWGCAAAAFERAAALDPKDVTAADYAARAKAKLKTP